MLKMSYTTQFMPTEFAFTAQDMFKLPWKVKSELSFLKTYDMIRVVCDILNIIWVIPTTFFSGVPYRSYFSYS